MNLKINKEIRKQTNNEFGLCNLDYVQLYSLLDMINLDNMTIEEAVNSFLHSEDK